MSPRSTRALLAGVLVAAVLLLATVGLSPGSIPSSPAQAALVPATRAVGGNLTGPTILSIGENATFSINASGGPAFNANGTKVGNFTYFASVAASNLSGVSISPAKGNLTGNRSARTSLDVGPNAESVVITVMVSSVYQKQNQSINLSATVAVVVPYVVTAEIINGPSATVLSFPVVIDLDSNPIGTVTVPTLIPGASYNLTFRYPTLGLSSGDHTFSISLANEHGLVHFANGQTSYSTTVYVAPGATNYTVWYVTGAVAFLGVLFIFATRVAARRRGALRK